MTSLSSPPTSHSTNPSTSILLPALLIRAPTFRAADTAPSFPRPSTPPAAYPQSSSTLCQPSPTPSNASRYSVELPTYDDYEHIPELPSPPRALSPYRDVRRGHERSASVPHNEFLNPDRTSAVEGRARAQSHQRSRTELLPAFVSQTLRRTLSRSPARGGDRSPERRYHSRSPSPEKRERSGSALGMRGGGTVDGMPLTGDGRVSAAARRRAAVSGSEGDLSAGLASATPVSPGGPAIKGLGTWISGAAAQVSATVSQVASGNRPGLERQRSESLVASSGLQRRDSLRSSHGTPGIPSASSPSSLRPAPPASNTPSFGGAAKATFTSLFTSKPAPPPTSNPEEDELCTLDLLATLPVPSEGTSAADLHKTAMSLLRRYQGQCKARIQQVQSLKQEAEVRDEELEGHTVRGKSLKAQLEAMARTVQERDEVLRKREQTLRELREELREKNAFIDEIAGLEPQTPLEELDGEEVEGRRESRTTEDTESVFSGRATANDTPNTHTTNTSSASSIRAVSTLRPELREGLATSSLLSPLSSSEVDKRPQAPFSGKTTMPYKCENCQGSSSSHAWVALSRIRTENQGLKDDNRQLQDCIDGALGVVNAAKRGRGVMSG